MTGCWRRWRRRPRQAAAGSRCWWAGRRPGRPGRAGRRWDVLRDQDQRWRLWHPIDPSRPEAALRDLSSIGPRTVIMAERSPVLPRCPRSRPGRAGRRRAAGAAARPGPGPGPRAGHALARILARHDCPSSRRRAGSSRPGPGAPGGSGYYRARRLHSLPAERPHQGARPAAGQGSRSVARWAGRSVPGRAPELVARYRNAPVAAAAADQRCNRCPPHGHGHRTAAGFHGGVRTGVSDRRPMGRPRRGLVGTSPGLHSSLV